MAFEDIAELLIILDADDRATEKINSAKRAVMEYAAAVDAANAEMAAATDRSNQADAAAQRLSTDLGSAGREATAMGTADRDARKAVDDMANALSNAKDEEQNLSDAFGQGIAAGDKIAKQIGAVAVVSKNLERDLRTLRKTLGDAFAEGILDADDLRAEVDKANKVLDELNFNLHTAGKDAVDSFGQADAAIRETRNATDELAHSSQVLHDDQGALFGVLRSGDRDFAAFHRSMSTAVVDVERMAGPLRDLRGGMRIAASAVGAAAMSIIRSTGNVAQQAQAQLGKVPALFQAIAAAAVVAAPFIAGALIGIVGTAFVVVAGLAQKSNTDFAAAFSNLKTTITDGTKAATAQLVPTFVSAMNQVSAALKALAPEFTQLFGEMKPVIQSLADSVIGFVQGAMPGLIAGFQNFKPLGDAFAAGMRAMGTQFGNFFKILAPAMPQIAQGTKLFMQAFADLIPILANVIKALVPIGTVILQKLIVPILDFIATHPKLVQFITWLVVALAGLALAFSSPVGAIIVAASLIIMNWDKIKKATSAVVNAVVGAFNWMKDHIVAAFDAVRNFLYMVIGKIIEFFVTLGVGIQREINVAINFVRQLPGKILDLFKDAGQWLINAGRAILDGFLNGLKHAWNAVTGFIGGIGNWISQHKGPIAKDAQLLIPHGQAIMGGLLKGLRSGSGGVQSYLKGFTADIGHTPLSASLSAAMSGGIGAGVGGSGGNVYLTFTGNQVMNDQSMQQFAQVMGKQVAKYMMPQAGRYVKG